MKVSLIHGLQVPVAAVHRGLSAVVPHHVGRVAGQTGLPIVDYRRSGVWTFSLPPPIIPDSGSDTDQDDEDRDHGDGCGGCTTSSVGVVISVWNCTWGFLGFIRR